MTRLLLVLLLLVSPAWAATKVKVDDKDLKEVDVGLDQSTQAQLELAVDRCGKNLQGCIDAQNETSDTFLFEGASRIHPDLQATIFTSNCGTGNNLKQLMCWQKNVYDLGSALVKYMNSSGKSGLHPKVKAVIEKLCQGTPSYAADAKSCQARATAQLIQEVTAANDGFSEAFVRKTYAGALQYACKNGTPLEIDSYNFSKKPIPKRECKPTAMRFTPDEAKAKIAYKPMPFTGAKPAGKEPAKDPKVSEVPPLSAAAKPSSGPEGLAEGTGSGGGKGAGKGITATGTEGGSPGGGPKASPSSAPGGATVLTGTGTGTGTGDKKGSKTGKPGGTGTEPNTGKPLGTEKKKGVPGGTDDVTVAAGGPNGGGGADDDEKCKRAKAAGLKCTENGKGTGGSGSLAEKEKDGLFKGECPGMLAARPCPVGGKYDPEAYYENNAAKIKQKKRDELAKSAGLTLLSPGVGLYKTGKAAYDVLDVDVGKEPLSKKMDTTYDALKTQFFDEILDAQSDSMMRAFGEQLALVSPDDAAFKESMETVGGVFACMKGDFKKSIDQAEAVRQEIKGRATLQGAKLDDARDNYRTTMAQAAACMAMLPDRLAKLGLNVGADLPTETDPLIDPKKLENGNVIVKGLDYTVLSLPFVRQALKEPWQKNTIPGQLKRPCNYFSLQGNATDMIEIPVDQLDGSYKANIEIGGKGDFLAYDPATQKYCGELAAGAARDACLAKKRHGLPRRDYCEASTAQFNHYGQQLEAMHALFPLLSETYPDKKDGRAGYLVIADKSPNLLNEVSRYSAIGGDSSSCLEHLVKQGAQPSQAAKQAVDQLIAKKMLAQLREKVGKGVADCCADREACAGAFVGDSAFMQEYYSCTKPRYAMLAHATAKPDSKPAPAEYLDQQTCNQRRGSAWMACRLNSITTDLAARKQLAGAMFQAMMDAMAITGIGELAHGLTGLTKGMARLLSTEGRAALLAGAGKGAAQLGKAVAMGGVTGVGLMVGQDALLGPGSAEYIKAQAKVQACDAGKGGSKAECDAAREELAAMEKAKKEMVADGVVMGVAGAMLHGPGEAGPKAGVTERGFRFKVPEGEGPHLFKDGAQTVHFGETGKGVSHAELGKPGMSGVEVAESAYHDPKFSEKVKGKGAYEVNGQIIFADSPAHAVEIAADAQHFLPGKDPVSVRVIRSPESATGPPTMVAGAKKPAPSKVFGELKDGTVLEYVDAESGKKKNARFRSFDAVEGVVVYEDAAGKTYRVPVEDFAGGMKGGELKVLDGGKTARSVSFSQPAETYSEFPKIKDRLKKVYGVEVVSGEKAEALLEPYRKKGLDPEAFYDPDTKRIVLSKKASLETFFHEIKHVKQYADVAKGTETIVTKAIAGTKDVKTGPLKEFRVHVAEIDAELKSRHYQAMAGNQSAVDGYGAILRYRLKGLEKILGELPENDPHRALVKETVDGLKLKIAEADRILPKGEPKGKIILLGTEGKVDPAVKMAALEKKPLEKPGAGSGATVAAPKSEPLYSNKALVVAAEKDFHGMPGHVEPVKNLRQKPMPMGLPAPHRDLLMFYSAEFRPYAESKGYIYEHRSVAELPPGNYTYIVLEDGSTTFGRVTNTWEVGVNHMNLAQGRPVLLAGEVRVNPDGSISYNTVSGTFTREIKKGLKDQGPAWEAAANEKVGKLFKAQLGDKKVTSTPEILLPTDKVPSFAEILEMCQGPFGKANAHICQLQAEHYAQKSGSGAQYVYDPAKPVAPAAPVEPAKPIGPGKSGPAFVADVAYPDGSIRQIPVSESELVARYGADAVAKASPETRQKMVLQVGNQKAMNMVMVFDKPVIAGVKLGSGEVATTQGTNSYLSIDPVPGEGRTSRIPLKVLEIREVPGRGRMLVVLDDQGKVRWLDEGSLKSAKVSATAKAGFESKPPAPSSIYTPTGVKVATEGIGSYVSFDGVGPDGTPMRRPGRVLEIARDAYGKPVLVVETDLGGIEIVGNAQLASVRLSSTSKGFFEKRPLGLTAKGFKGDVGPRLREGAAKLYAKGDAGTAKWLHDVYSHGIDPALAAAIEIAARTGETDALVKAGFTPDGIAALRRAEILPPQPAAVAAKPGAGALFSQKSLMAEVPSESPPPAKPIGHADAPAVWDRITETAPPEYPAQVPIPKAFVLESVPERVWVGPNGSKHLVEDLVGSLNHKPSNEYTTPMAKQIVAQRVMADLESATGAAMKSPEFARLKAEVAKIRKSGEKVVTDPKSPACNDPRLWGYFHDADGNMWEVGIRATLAGDPAQAQWAIYHARMVPAAKGPTVAFRGARPELAAERLPAAASP